MFEAEILDDDGYPTEEFLDAIRQWPHQNGWRELLDFAMLGHTYPHMREIEKIEYYGMEKELRHISTGGWSGNESIIGALRENALFWMVCWVQSRRGGHFQFMCDPPPE